MNLGPSELMIVLVICLVLFGGARLPKLARNLGQAQKELKDATAEGSTSQESRAEAASA